jgi:DNA invertase Pin-like site-specific DNA recombinase
MMTVKAGCYCRISSDPKDKREGVDRQREDTTALCEIKGWIPAGFYIDNDRSASNGKGRPEWDRLLADITAARIDAVAAWDQDRGWRMMHELEELRKFFDKLGRTIPLATTGQGDIDLYSPTGVLTAQIKTAVSEHEIAMMKVRTRRKHLQKAQQGIPNWRNAFGYMSDGSRQPDPHTAPLVAQAYAAVLVGASLADICRMWNDADAFTLGGKPWIVPLVSNFLRKPRNAGLRAHNNEIIGKGNWPALIDESTWRAAQSTLDAPSRRPGRKTVRKHLLTGVLGCQCGHYLSGRRLSAHTVTYECKRCLKVSIRAGQVEPLLYRIVSERLAMPDAVDLLTDDALDEAEAETIRAELATLHQDLIQIGIDRGHRLLTSEQAKAATDVIEADIAKLQTRQHDQERLRVFDGIPLGTPEAGPAIRALSPDRFRAILGVLLTITIAPVGRGGPVFNPRRVHVDWRQ